MNSDQLDYFLLVYNTQSIQKAAAIVPMSPQGMAKSIKALEQELGAPLFTREPNGKRSPTEYAQVFREFALMSQAEMDRTLLRFVQIRAREQKTIRLASALGLSGLFGNECIDVFRRKRPDVAFELRETDDLTCDELVASGACDLGLTLSPFGDGLTTIPLASERVYAWVSTVNPLSQRTALLPADLASTRVALFGQRQKLDASVRAAVRQEGFELQSVTYSPEVFWHYNLALENRAIGITVEHLTTLPMFTDNPNVVALPIQDMNWTYGISHEYGRVLYEHEQAFFDYAIAYARKHCA
ncbi:Cyn operon transcriptional activator [Slackia heliotrinireducens]|uniref:Transcriptional regulator n=1 Tax=Slackia heliotrinireducens (strain ATCC 29202 / DSM 20476 / NCTC 11029 / RHS 1) TaxID=471855 RepID=C7N4F0_SLAHD|nr:LysR family transcriptional regulator [Slackia heliotrinireducens]ACV21785.1 transcriptional regulator [Slackia heliotrinireducens DSM 20476]VEG99467.1 Cyn operon transcriptional activator [Slackia heliotrinireducens]